MAIRARSVILLAVVVAVGVFLAVLTGRGANEANLADCESADSGELLPSATLEHWKSYADHLLVFTVLSVRQPEDGLRVATYRVDRILWSAPAAPRPPRRMDKRLLPRTHMPPGERFISPFVRFEFEQPPVWSPLGGCSPLLLDGGRVAESQSDSLRSRLSGRSVEDVAAALRATPPDSLAQRFRRLRPLQRYHTVRRLQGFRHRR